MRKKRMLEHAHIIMILLMIYDIVAIHAAYFVALWGRFDFVYSQIQANYLYNYEHSITIYAVCCVVVFWFFRLYRSIWRFASYNELTRTALASFVMSVVYGIAITFILGRMPRTYYLWGAITQFLLVLGIRFSYRVLLFMRARRAQRGSGAAGDSRVMIIGAGAAGQMLLRDIVTSSEGSDKVVCIIDDNPNKWDRYIDGVPVVGGRDSILPSVQKYAVTRIYLAIPSASVQVKRDLLNICKESGCELKQLPGMYQLALGEVSVNAMKDVDVVDLLGREPIVANLPEVFDFIHGKTVLVTGGGGSIGSELCRQVALHGPKKLVILDIYENSTYDIQLELREKYPELDLTVLIGSVRDSRKIFQVFETYRPEIVYHAAAHKHVPLMEDSPCEAIKNNALGTYKTAYAAMVNGCERFVLISTDKAVNPTNVMGASKRICEMIVQSFDAKIKAGKAAEIPELFTHWSAEEFDADGSAFANIRTEFVAVRFGNVLGSNGSVIPIFKKQIAEGGPVTVTHPDIVRYFMTIPEAVSLVMLAGTYAHGGEIFVLDMGEPVKIDTLARNLIKLSGFKPDVDIRIEYTGLRPGEKLYEEKLMAEEGLTESPNKLIFIGKPIPFDADEFLKKLEPLMDAAYKNKADIRERIAEVVETYRPVASCKGEK